MGPPAGGLHTPAPDGRHSHQKNTDSQKAMAAPVVRVFCVRVEWGQGMRSPNCSQGMRGSGTEAGAVRGTASGAENSVFDRLQMY